MATQVRPVNKKKVSSTPGIELAELRASGQTKNPRSAHLQLNSGDDDAGGGDSEPLLQKNEVSAAVEKNRREAKQGGHPETKHGGHAESKHGGAAETKRGTKQPTASGAKASTSGDVLLDVNAAIPEPNYADDISASALMEQLAALRDKDKDILSNFVDEFRAEAPEQEIIVGSVDVEDIALQERAYEEARVKELEGLARKHQQREIDLLHRERVARATVETERQQLRARHREREKELVQQTKVNRQRLKTYFRQAEDKLKRAIKSEQGAVHELFGDLESGERTTLRRWRASWNHKPIPLQIDIERITAVKDKIPAGVYVVLVSLFDRMGGKPLKWSKADAGLYEKLKPSTQPLVHKGRFYDIDMKINQSVFVVSPSETKVEPSMCFVFELFRLADKKIPVDRCVGWTVMPMVDAHMNITHGKFKLPILCGPVNRKIDRYGAFTEWYSDDINRYDPRSCLVVSVFFRAIPLLLP